MQATGDIDRNCKVKKKMKLVFVWRFNDHEHTDVSSRNESVTDKNAIQLNNLRFEITLIEMQFIKSNAEE